MIILVIISSFWTHIRLVLVSADTQVAELLSGRIKQYGNMCTHYIWPMKLYIYSDSIGTRGRQQHVTAHISVLHVSSFCIFSSFCCMRSYRKLCHSRCRSVVRLWRRRAAGCFQRLHSLPVVQRRLNQINSSVAETSEPRHILNVEEIKSSEARLAFAFGLLRNVTHHFQ